MKQVLLRLFILIFFCKLLKFFQNSVHSWLLFCCWIKGPIVSQFKSMRRNFDGLKVCSYQATPPASSEQTIWYATHSACHSAHQKDQRCCPSMLRWRWWSRSVWTDLKSVLENLEYEIPVTVITGTVISLHSIFIFPLQGRWYSGGHFHRETDFISCWCWQEGSGSCPCSDYNLSGPGRHFRCQTSIWRIIICLM